MRHEPDSADFLSGAELPDAPRKILFFDVDGTVIDSFPGIRASFLHALDSVGIPHPDEEFTARIPGPPMEVSLGRLIDDPARLREAFTAYLDHAHAGGVLDAAVYDGIADLLPRLKKQGFYLSTATSKGETNARRALTHLGVLEHFDFLAAAEEDGPRRPKEAVIDYALHCLKLHARADDILMIGDRHHDIDGARHHGLKVCAAAWGYGTAEEWAEADYTARTVQELEEIIHDWSR